MSEVRFFNEMTKLLLCLKEEKIEDTIERIIKFQWRCFRRRFKIPDYLKDME